MVETVTMKLKQRIYEDYFKPSRLPDYERVLTAFHNAGYQMVGVLDYYKMRTQGGVNGKVFINRHDIDTSPKVAGEMFEIEKAVYGHDGSSTYYFRNSTFDIGIIKSINEYGYEIGYHYEELATCEKIHKFKDKEKILESMPECRKMFLANIERFRGLTGCPCLTVASHGDFVNVKCDISNNEILSDKELRQKSGIVIEAYDDVVTQDIEVRYADQVLLGDFSAQVLAGIAQEKKVIMTLTHPRNWKVDVIANTKDNITRFWQGWNYRK